MATTTNSKDSFDEAIDFVCDRKFHQSITLPATADHDQLRVTFSTTRNFDDTSLPAILMCGPMFATRQHVMGLDRLARDEGVRMVTADRPGMGGSTRVLLNMRLRVWVEAIPFILEKLGVKHVYLISHSAGTMFAMHTLYHLRHWLAPRGPYMGFIVCGSDVVNTAPWVHNEHTDAMLPKIVSKIPSGAYDRWSDVNRFINQRIMPVSTWSGGIIGSVTSIFQSGSTATDDASGADLTPGQLYGTSEATGKEIDKLRAKISEHEDFTGPNDEAKLCIRKDGVKWDICQDYEEFVRSMNSKEAEQRAAHPDAAKLKVRVYFAASDIMISNGGRAYFDQAWRKNVSKDIDYDSIDLPDTNHDSAILDQEKGALRKIFQEIKDVHV